MHTASTLHVRCRYALYTACTLCALKLRCMYITPTHMIACVMSGVWRKLDEEGCRVKLGGHAATARVLIHCIQSAWTLHANDVHCKYAACKQCTNACTMYVRYVHCMYTVCTEVTLHMHCVYTAHALLINRLYNPPSPFTLHVHDAHQIYTSLQ